MIIDTHAHITDPKFEHDRDSVLQRASQAGISKFFEISCQPSHWQPSLELSKVANIFVSFGVHPNNIKKASNQDYENLQALIQENKCIGVGETGLDYHYDSSIENKKLQKEAFEKQLLIAKKYNKPVILHCRDAYDDMLDFFKNHDFLPKGVVHCFSGSLNQAKKFVEMGFLLGIDGPLTYKNSQNLKQTVLETDISKLLVETDCPYLSPQKYRGLRNEPSYIIETIKEIAILKNLSFADTVNITTQNALQLFRI